MTYARFEIDRTSALENFLLELLYDCAAGDDFAREQIGAAHEYSDLYTGCGKRRRHDLQQGAGHLIVDPACEDDVHFLAPDLAQRQLCQQAIDDRAPQHEARQRSNVAAALAALENETARALLQEQRDQIRRRYVQKAR